MADFKTNRDRRPAVADTPVLYLRQMAAYRAVLRAIFPGPARALRAGLDPGGAGRASLPDALLDPHAPGHAAAPA